MAKLRADNLTKVMGKDVPGDRPTPFDGFLLATVTDASPPPKGPRIKLTRRAAWKDHFFGPCFVNQACLISLQLLSSQGDVAGARGYKDPAAFDDAGESVRVEAEVIRPSSKAIEPDSGQTFQERVYGLLKNKRVLVHFLGGDPDEPVIFDVILGGGLFRTDEAAT